MPPVIAIHCICPTTIIINRSHTMPLMPRSTSKGDTSLKMRRTSINSNDGDQTTKLLITTKDGGTDDENGAIEVSADKDALQPPSTPMPTIYPNDFDFDIENSLKSKSTSRSFVRPAKTLSQEHRNRSVPHNLQVRQNEWSFSFTLCSFLSTLLLLAVNFNNIYVVMFVYSRGTFTHIRRHIEYSIFGVANRDELQVL